VHSSGSDQDGIVLLPELGAPLRFALAPCYPIPRLRRSAPHSPPSTARCHAIPRLLRQPSAIQGRGVAGNYRAPSANGAE
jgi:hypothetical protein